MIMVKYIMHSANVYYMHIFVGHCILNLHFLIINEAECFFLFLPAIWIFFLLKGSIQWYSTCLVLVRPQVKRKEGSERVREEREACYNIMFFFFLVLGIKPRALQMPGKCLTTELHHQPSSLVIFIYCLALFY